MARTPKYTKRQVAALAKSLDALLREFGAVDAEPGEKWASMYPLRLETSHGPYVCKVDVSETSATVFGRFTADVKPVCANQYTGKWNHHHFASSHTAADVLRLMRWELENCADATWLGGDAFPVIAVAV